MSKAPKIEKAPDSQKPTQATQAEILLNLVSENGAAFFHDETDTPYASIPMSGHRETWCMNSYQFKLWLKRLFYNHSNGKPIQNEALGQVMGVLEGRALFDGKRKPLSVRVAAYNNAFLYDLTDAQWRAVRITEQGWNVAQNPPHLFVRYSHHAPQVLPQSGGDINTIFHHINVSQHETLFLCWLVSCFVPDIPHPIPIFYGEKGAAKSTVCGFLKALIDPSILDTLTFPNDAGSLAVNLRKNWFLPFDNVSYISEETSDTLCRAVTGGGLQQRRLHTNDEDAIFKFMRCIAINGINCTASRSDLLDRSILIELSRISEANRRELSAVKAAFEKDRPYILGGIFDLLVKAKKLYPMVELDQLPRMADFTRWGYAIAQALGGYGENFIIEYEENRERQNTEAINADPVAMLMIAFMKERKYWEGRASELLAELTLIAPENGINPKTKSFPSQPNQLTRRLRGMKSNLLEAGVSFETKEKNTGTFVYLTSKKVTQISNPTQLPNSVQLKSSEQMELPGTKPLPYPP